MPSPGLHLVESPSAASLIEAAKLRHLAVIMDGNRRWARRVGKGVTEGHAAGMEALIRLVRHTSRAGLRYFTAYAFSTENWSRPKDEVEGLMALFAHTIDRLLPEVMADRGRMRFLGAREGLPPELQERMDHATEVTRGNPGMTFQIALNYGGRRELVDAFRSLLAEALATGRGPGSITEADVARHLYQPDCPDPDLVLRTGGEQRLSNFLLWEVAYAEVMVVDTLWPELDEQGLDRAFVELARRTRRFGR